MLRAVPNESFGIYVSDFLSHTVISVFLMVCLHISLQNPTAYCHSNLHIAMIFDDSDWRHQVTQTELLEGRTVRRTITLTEWLLRHAWVSVSTQIFTSFLYYKNVPILLGCMQNSIGDRNCTLTNYEYWLLSQSMYRSSNCAFQTFHRVKEIGGKRDLIKWSGDSNCKIIHWTEGKYLLFCEWKRKR